MPRKKKSKKWSADKTIPLAPENHVQKRHTDLVPKTLTGLKDALSLNGIPFKWHLDGQYEAICKTAKLEREINPYDGGEILEFFKDALCRH